jgi:cyclophilin family peptidyl-prolyl cis-trans isomerase/HEAT repeat protein
MFRSVCAAVLLATGLQSCTPKEEPPNKFADENHVRIAEWQDRRHTDSLLLFLRHNAPYRAVVALAFGSVQDSTASDVLGELVLADADSAVLAAAAFALGQTAGTKASEYLLRRLESIWSAVAEEALGKAVQRKEEIPDMLYSWGLYRLTLRGLADSTHVNKAIIMLAPHSNEDMRLGAAHFFARSSTDVHKAQTALIRAVREDPSAYVRMAAAGALGKINSQDVLAAIMDLLPNETDYRVRINLVRSLRPYSLAQASEALFGSLSDENVNVRIAVAETIRQSAAVEDYQVLTPYARAESNWRVRANLYAAALAVSNQKELAEELVRVCSNSTNPYEKAALIEALSYSPMQYSFVKEQLLTSEVPVVRSSSATALGEMNRHRDFEPPMQNAFLEIYKAALKSGDLAVIGIIASTLMDPKLGYKELVKDITFLYEAKNMLNLPRDIEALQPLEGAIAYFEGRAGKPPVTNEFNHPIDWLLVKSIPRNHRVVVKTSKGDIEMQLLVEEAPGSVANFLQLVRKGYFDKKNFHRVVPNFVIQGGCHRGDGWGSEDYSIRSEFSGRKYKEGSVGMASAGKDTEGTQWFITHSPTPHLDGRYTIFAEVVKGMDAVHRIEVGDQIISVTEILP